MGHIDFAWQTRFYDRILWDNKQINHVRRYIRNNPLQYR